MGPDPRFYEDLGPASLSELARLTGATLADGADGERMIEGVAPLDQAGPAQIGFLSDRRYQKDLAATRAGACFVNAKTAPLVPEGCTALLSDTPQAAWAMASERLHRLRRHAPGAAIDASAEFEDGVQLAPGVVMGAGARIGRGTVIGANTVIGPGVAIGRDGRIGANVTLFCALVGDRVSILSGATIGEAGFGAAQGPKGAVDVPQLGRVIIQDGVTIGAGTSIDRGAFADTVIGENTKIDNLVQVAHNVRLGRNCLLAAHTGISGSVVVGDNVAFGGRAGVADHVNIGDGAMIAAAAGVMKDVPAKEFWGGSPARPLRSWLRETAWLARNAAKGKGGSSSEGEGA